MSRKLNLTLNVWRQKNANDAGRFVRYDAKGIDEHMSFLEMLDVVNEGLIEKGEDPIAFDHDCREGICGACGMVINGVAHGSQKRTTTCQLHMRHFKDGQEVWLEPWRAKPFPVVKDLIVDRSSLDRIIQAGGYVSVRTGGIPDANAIPVPKSDADLAFDAATCIGCGACVAACPNASANLFMSAKIAHLGLLPQGQPERARRAKEMLAQHDAEGFGSCSQHKECEAVCPKGISFDFIARMNRDVLMSMLSSAPERQDAGGSSM
ncbi:MAG: succinate dehydrogenase/fumarate reductase iron-sulfur subunit [Deltaproteobacteria bacterium]|nr:succinate dehydrogenase/fumarate reductase iron-sulfur subunit [Deltaproteobacteria bacterium]